MGGKVSSSYNSDLTSDFADPCKIMTCTLELVAVNMYRLIITSCRCPHDLHTEGSMQ